MRLWDWVQGHFEPLLGDPSQTLPHARQGTNPLDVFTIVANADTAELRASEGTLLATLQRIGD